VISAIIAVINIQMRLIARAIMKENKHVLLVDDEEEIVIFMQNFLKRFKIASTKAVSGEEALMLYDPSVMDFVFLDLHMNGIDGFTVFERLKVINPEIKVIIIAGSNDTESMDRAREMGALDYITKPIDLGDFKKKIDKYILEK
jgi:DNA-binding NtrC family response regulator